jgi:hypothetical protein
MAKAKKVSKCRAIAMDRQVGSGHRKSRREQ